MGRLEGGSDSKNHAGEQRNSKGETENPQIRIKWKKDRILRVADVSNQSPAQHLSQCDADCGPAQGKNQALG